MGLSAKLYQFSTEFVDMVAENLNESIVKVKVGKLLVIEKKSEDAISEQLTTLKAKIDNLVKTIVK